MHNFFLNYFKERNERVKSILDDYQNDRYIDNLLTVERELEMCYNLINDRISYQQVLTSLNMDKSVKTVIALYNNSVCEFNRVSQIYNRERGSGHQFHNHTGKLNNRPPLVSLLSTANNGEANGLHYMLKRELGKFDKLYGGVYFKNRQVDFENNNNHPSSPSLFDDGGEVTSKIKKTKFSSTKSPISDEGAESEDVSKMNNDYNNEYPSSNSRNLSKVFVSLPQSVIPPDFTYYDSGQALVNDGGVVEHHDDDDTNTSSTRNNDSIVTVTNRIPVVSSSSTYSTYSTGHNNNHHQNTNPNNNSSGSSSGNNNRLPTICSWPSFSFKKFSVKKITPECNNHSENGTGAIEHKNRRQMTIDHHNNNLHNNLNNNSIVRHYHSHCASASSQSNGIALFDRYQLKAAVESIALIDCDLKFLNPEIRIDCEGVMDLIFFYNSSITQKLLQLARTFNKHNTLFQSVWIYKFWCIAYVSTLLENEKILNRDFVNTVLRAVDRWRHLDGQDWKKIHNTLISISNNHYIERSYEFFMVFVYMLRCNSVCEGAIGKFAEICRDEYNDNRDFIENLLITRGFLFHEQSLMFALLCTLNARCLNIECNYWLEVLRMYILGDPKKSKNMAIDKLKTEKFTITFKSWN